ncbi:uncharacterized protein HMPREF1120_07811 [Exophiala dermatitidis NIH/UT8656]|uniref:Secreted protein n=1 Tax=Exophiala dermatitidis (strain ATCC 34100 / CBS 525.76 / NIH/UT8656) TaxID=858893 RepID=H6C5H3_EXODN|nr:uncharacterized protein HMPREF1120_07811 [Exophiala dermatitidis NIH/UT8656]EHY59831.1 hypothetical protein HMPREF1120_07811 [Exophiala dermatitidis NIH/UT8656]
MSNETLALALLISCTARLVWTTLQQQDDPPSLIVMLRHYSRSLSSFQPPRVPHCRGPQNSFPKRQSSLCGKTFWCFRISADPSARREGGRQSLHQFKTALLRVKCHPSCKTSSRHGTSGNSNTLTTCRWLGGATSLFYGFPL